MQLNATLCDYSHGGQYVFWVIPDGIDAWTDPSPPPPAVPPPPPPIVPAADSTKNLPFSPEACIGITVGTVVAIGVVVTGLLSCRQAKMKYKMADNEKAKTSACSCSFGPINWAMNQKNSERMLSFEFIDWILDWITFGLALWA